MKHLKRLRQHWNEPLWWRRIAVPYVTSSIHRSLPESGIDISEQEWDNLLILDACRYDMFEEQHDLPGRLEKRRSAGSNTPEFLRTNFADGEFGDTVYVTANPQVNVHLDDEFFAIVNVWKDEWDDEYHTVRPGVMAKRSLEANRAYPNKRLIAHFIQPHYPFIGEIGQQELNRHSGMELSKRLATDERAERDRTSVWDQLFEGTVSRDVVWRAYRENLAITLPHVKRLMESLQGLTVVTSDHGNAVGERAWPIPTRLYGHPAGIRISALVEVPWLVHQSGQRKDVHTGESTVDEDSDDQVIEKRLADLGYV